MISALGNAAVQRLARSGLLAHVVSPQHPVLARNGHGTLQYPPRSRDKDPEGYEADVRALYTPEGVGSELPKGYRKFVFHGGTVYVRSNSDPSWVFQNGWGWDGDPDIVRHVTVDQGAHSCWIATSMSPTALPQIYGPYLFEVELKPYQAIHVNETYETLTKHKNPHFHQEEIAVWRRILAKQITAVHVRTASDTVERLTARQYGDLRKAGLIAHPPPGIA